MEKNDRHTVVVLGASDKPDRYSNMAVRLLKREGYHVIPVHPRLKEIEGLAVAGDLQSVTEPVDTLTLYIGPQRIAAMIGDIVRLHPSRVILNPGTESDPLEENLDRAGIPYIKGCTLVMVQSGQFDSVI